MKVTFHSLDNDGNKVFYKTDAKAIDSYIEFRDGSTKNTIIRLSYTNSSIIIERIGDINMVLNLELDKTTGCMYKDNLGLELDLEIKTNELEVKNNKLYANYDLILDKNVISSHKIWILFA